MYSQQKMLELIAVFVKILMLARYIFKPEQPESCFAPTVNDAGHQHSELSLLLSEKPPFGDSAHDLIS